MNLFVSEGYYRVVIFPLVFVSYICLLLHLVSTAIVRYIFVRVVVLLFTL
jgi:hypothetical protein